MSKELLEVFIEGVVRYFQHTPDKDVTVGTPYLVENSNPVAHDFTGLIGVSGSMRGCVYFTAPKELLQHLLLSMGEENIHKENIADMVGEVANTISGNARSKLGGDFMISVPVVIEGTPGNIHLPTSSRSYVIPVYWKAYSSAVVICFENGTSGF